MDLSAVWREVFKACLHACMPFWEQQQEQREAEQKHTCSFFKENQLWIVSWDIIKSLLSWCALTWLVWIDYQLISGMSFTKTLILWQRLNSSPVYWITGFVPLSWVDDSVTGPSLTCLPSLQFCSVFLCLLPFLLHPRALSQSRICCQPQQQWRCMNQGFHFSIITTMTINTVQTLQAGCKCDFLIAQVY